MSRETFDRARNVDEDVNLTHYQSKAMTTMKNKPSPPCQTCTKHIFSLVPSTNLRERPPPPPPPPLQRCYLIEQIYTYMVVSLTTTRFITGHNTCIILLCVDSTTHISPSPSCNRVNVPIVKYFNQWQKIFAPLRYSHSFYEITTSSHRPNSTW